MMKWSEVLFVLPGLKRKQRCDDDDVVTADTLYLRFNTNFYTSMKQIHCGRGAHEIRLRVETHLPALQQFHQNIKIFTGAVWLLG